MSEKNTFVLTGMIKSVGNKQQITDRFAKKAIVIDITDNPQYPRVVEVEFTNKNIDKITGRLPGQLVSVSCEVESRPSKDGSRYFTAVRGFSVSDVVGSQGGHEPQKSSEDVEDYPF